MKKPDCLVVNLKEVFQGALSYVMLSRVESLDQVYLINDVYPKKIYPDEKAKEVLCSMMKETTSERKAVLDILSLNIRSLYKHFQDLILEDDIECHDLILLQQTCLTVDEPPPDKFHIDKYKCHFNSLGAGGGLAVYYKDCFHHVKDVNSHQHQVSKFSSESYDVICVYRSKNESKEVQIQFLSDLEKLLDSRKKTVITGDFNTSVSSVISSELSNWNFKQIISYPTHIEGNLIDHCYISDKINISSLKIQQKPVYYTDHDKMHIVIQ